MPARKRSATIAAAALAAVLASAPPAALAGRPPSAQTEAEAPDVDLFLQATVYDPAAADEALQQIAAGWQDGHASILVDLLDLLRRTSLVDPRSWIVLGRLVDFLERQTGQAFGTDLASWRRWVWDRPYEPHPAYGEFKGLLYGRLDPRFADFFQPPVRSAIRLDEVDWGGVAVNGIPPLDHPAHVTVAEAGYLEDDHVVFGVFIDGVARAYPKRILAWHELALDRVGTRDLTLVYCTLCGTVIPYDSHVGGVARTFGTSGLLYQSNKLMFDRSTHSLWSSLEGVPVVGPLVGSGLRLSVLPVVTTTWGEWRTRHPDTTVLSLETGFTRDYSEGAAYRGYFATDALMFGVSRQDGRLRNKAEVLVLRLAPGATPTRPVALSTAFLGAHPVYRLEVAERSFVVITSLAGASRVYEAGPHRFEAAPDEGRLVDAGGGSWRIEEDALRAVESPDQVLPRVPAHRAFWFGWYAQHPDTLLID
jgi:hypothetical protein